MTDCSVYFKSLVEQDNTAIVICDLNHTIIYMNPSAILNYKKYGGTALLGKSLLACHNENSAVMIEKVVQWFSESANNNRVHTAYNEKQRHLHDCVKGRRQKLNRLLRKARVPQQRHIPFLRNIGL